MSCSHAGIPRLSGDRDLESPERQDEDGNGSAGTKKRDLTNYLFIYTTSNQKLSPYIYTINYIDQSRFHFYTTCKHFCVERKYSGREIRV